MKTTHIHLTLFEAKALILDYLSYYKKYFNLWFMDGLFLVKVKLLVEVETYTLAWAHLSYVLCIN